jgi:hypothetical protein
MHGESSFELFAKLLPSSVFDGQGTPDSPNRIAFRIEEIGWNDTKPYQTLGRGSSAYFWHACQNATHLVDEILTVQGDDNSL